MKISQGVFDQIVDVIYDATKRKINSKGDIELALYEPFEVKGRIQALLDSDKMIGED
jgi:hypothetical protein